MDIKHALKPPAGTSFLTERDREMARDRARRRRMAALEDRELLRLELKDKWYIEKLHSFAQLTVEHFREGGRELSNRDIQAIKTGSDILLKMLNKTLPDLKSVEKLSDPLADAQDAAKMSTAELLALARSHQPPIEAECTVVEPEPVVKHQPKSPRHLPFG